MDKDKMKKMIRFGVKTAGVSGIYMIGRQFIPYNVGPIGRICCEAGIWFLAMSTQDLIDKELLRCDAILEAMKNGDPNVVIF